MFSFLKQTNFQSCRKCFFNQIKQFKGFSIVNTQNKRWKVLFFGGDRFSLYSLEAIWKECRSTSSSVQNLEVVVNSERNIVGKFAKSKGLTLHQWPCSLEEGQFDVGLVVSFGHLIPESTIEKFPLGMLNVHGSLLPKYRGAAPIIHTLVNGDNQTGVTVMRLKPKQFDIGEIVSQQTLNITPEMMMPQLHEQLGRIGAELLVDAVKNLPQSVANATPQPAEGVSYAPKVLPEFGHINWEKMTANEIWNLYRALKGLYPLTTNWHSRKLKILDLNVSKSGGLSKRPGFVWYDKKTGSLIVECANCTFISLNLVNVPGKRNMTAKEFYNGYIKNVNEFFFL